MRTPQHVIINTILGQPITIVDPFEMYMNVIVVDTINHNEGPFQLLTGKYPTQTAKCILTSR